MVAFRSAMRGVSGGNAGANFRWMFDGQRVQREVDRAERQWLTKAGGYVYKVARTSIKRFGWARRAPKQFTKSGAVTKARLRWRDEMVERPASRPGTPPHTHEGHLKRAIRYSVATGSVVIGPTFTELGKIGATHEYGGTEPAKRTGKQRTNWRLVVGGHGPVAQRGDRLIFGRLKTARQVQRAKRIAESLPVSITGKPRRKYPPRPFMRPALEKSRQHLPQMMRNTIGA